MIERPTHWDFYAGRQRTNQNGDIERDDWMVLHMRAASFYIESAAYMLVMNDYDEAFNETDADYWHSRCKGIVFW